MIFSEDLKQYSMAYSFYQLMSDIAYSPLTKGYFLSTSSGPHPEVSFLCREREDDKCKNSRYYSKKDEFNFRGLRDKFYPEGCKDLNSNSNVSKPTVYGFEYNKGESRTGEALYLDEIISTINDEEKYLKWREKLKNLIESWEVLGDDNEKRKAFVTEIIYKLYMSPKFFYDFAENKWKYGKKSIFNLIDYDLNNNKMWVNTSTYDIFITLNEKNSDLTFFREINVFAPPNNEPFILGYRDKLNQHIQANQTYVYENDREVLKNIFELKYDDNNLTNLEKNIFRMCNTNPVELLISMIIFSVAIQYLIYEKGELSVGDLGESKKHLIFKLFFEGVDEGLSSDVSDLGKEIRKISEKAFVAYNNGDIDEEKSNLRNYKNLLPLLGMNTYSVNNIYCYTNILMCDLGAEFLGEEYLDPDELLKTIYKYCENNDTTNAANCERYTLGLVKYAKYIYENKLESKYDILERIINKLDEMDNVNFAEFYSLKAEIFRKGIKNFSKDYEKSYNAYTKLYSMLRDNSIIKDCIIPCLDEWIRSGQNSIYLSKNVSEWKENWEKLQREEGDFDFIQQKFAEKCKEILKDEIEKLNLCGIDINKLEESAENEKNNKSITIPENAKDVYIILGIGKASRSFINSIKKEEDSQVWIVPHENEIESIPSIINWYQENDNISVFTSGIDNVINCEGLELYNLLKKLSNINTKCGDDSRKSLTEIIENYECNIKKIHFVALDDDNKSYNLDSVVKIINSTYIRYYYYNLLSGVTGYKFDFSEVDIILNSNDQTSWYIDSVVNRFKDDFFITINYVSLNKMAVRELLTEYPLFLSDVNGLKKENGILENTGKHNVLILGSNMDVVPELVDSLLQVGVYMRNDIIESSVDFQKLAEHDYEEFESSIGNNLEITVIDENASEVRESIMYDSPDIFNADLDYIHTIPEFYDFPINTFGFTGLLYQSVSTNEEDDVNKIAGVLKSANYIVIAMDDSEEAMKLAIKIRNLRYRLNLKDEPVISVYTPDRNQDEDINQFTIGQDVFKDAFNRSYHINMFGKFQNIYSKKNLYDNILDRISLELHIDGKKNIKDKKRDYYKSVYNHRSCDCRSLAFIYVMYSVMGTKMIYDFELVCKDDDSNRVPKANNHWSMELFNNNIDNYLKEYNEVILKKGWIDALAVLEHNRWNYMLICEGYTGVAGNNQTDELIKRTIIEWANQIIDDKKENKLHIAKVHFAIRPFNELGDRVDIESLYYLKYAEDRIDDYKRVGIIKDFLSGNELKIIEENMLKEYSDIINNLKVYIRDIKGELEKKIKRNKYDLKVILTNDDITKIKEDYNKKKEGIIKDYTNEIEKIMKEERSGIDVWKNKGFEIIRKIKQREDVNEYDLDVLTGLGEDSIMHILEKYYDEEKKKEFKNKIVDIVEKMNEFQKMDMVTDEDSIKKGILGLSNEMKKNIDVKIIDTGELDNLLNKFIYSVIQQIKCDNNMIIGTECLDEDRIDASCVEYKKRLIRWVNRSIKELVESKYSILNEQLNEFLESNDKLICLVEQPEETICKLEWDKLNSLEDAIRKSYNVLKRNQYYEKLLSFEEKFKEVIRCADARVRDRDDNPIYIDNYNKCLGNFKKFLRFENIKINTVGIDKFEKLMDECYFEIKNRYNDKKYLKVTKKRNDYKKRVKAKRGYNGIKYLKLTKNRYNDRKYLKVTQNRYYDRKYLYEMANTMQSILERNRISEKTPALRDIENER